MKIIITKFYPDEFTVNNYSFKCEVTPNARGMRVKIKDNSKSFLKRTIFRKYYFLIIPFVSVDTIYTWLEKAIINKLDTMNDLTNEQKNLIVIRIRQYFMVNIRL